MTTTPQLTPRSLNGLKAVLTLRKLRNSCAHRYTGFTGNISVVSQILWYYKSYRRLEKNSEYRVWLFNDQQGRALAYGALSKDQNDLVLTECVAPLSRGRGAGMQVVNFLKTIVETEGMRAVALIKNDNIESIGLHQKAGFIQSDSGGDPDNLMFIWNSSPTQ